MELKLFFGDALVACHQLLSTSRCENIASDIKHVVSLAPNFEGALRAYGGCLDTK